MSDELEGVGADLIRAPAIVSARGGALGHPMVLLGETSSTNDLAIRAARDGAAHGSTWVTEQQTAGRGRRGHAWISPSGDGLLFSVLLRVSCAPARIPPIALVAGLAVRDAMVRAAPDAPIGIKWPNDVLVGARKVAGVLVEAVTVGASVEALVIGIGVNVHTRTFPDEIADRATSVARVSDALPDRATILADILTSLDRDVPLAIGRGLAPLLPRLEAADALRNHRVRSDTGDEGIAAGIDPDGRLRVRRDDGIVTHWAAGEVHLLEHVPRR